MGEHLILADLGAPLLLVGIRSPVYAFLIPAPALRRLARRKRLRAVFRKVRQPLVAVPLWILILYKLAFHILLFENAIRHDWVHVLQHQSFIVGSLLVWWSVIEPKRRRAGGDLWKVPYLIGARLPGMLLGMGFILMGRVAYPDPYARRTRRRVVGHHRPAGGGGDDDGHGPGRDAVRAVFFFYRSAQDHARAERRPRYEARGGRLRAGVALSRV